MFTEKGNRKKRGRPPGETAQGVAARQRLYNTAVALIAERGFDQTTLRDVASRANVSVGLLYRYFPSKQAVVLALYDELSAEQVSHAAAMPRGKWRDRFLFTLETTLTILRPHRQTLAALIPVLVSNAPDGLFSSSTASRASVCSASIKMPSSAPLTRRVTKWRPHWDGCCTSLTWPWCCGGCSTRVRNSARPTRSCGS